MDIVELLGLPNDAPYTNHELLDKAAAEIDRLRAQRDQLLNLLERASTVLGNMALENEGAIFNRWPISHEPLRADARGLLPQISAAIAAVEEKP